MSKKKSDLSTRKDRSSTGKSTKPSKSSSSKKSGLTKSSASNSFKLPRLAHGLLIFYGITSDIEGVVRATAEHGARTGSGRGAVRLAGKRNVTALHVGPLRVGEIATMLAGFFVGDPDSEVGGFEAKSLPSTAGEYDWSSAEARHVLKEHIEKKKGGCVTFSVTLDERADTRLINTLGHVADDAEQAQSLVMCFVTGPEVFALPLIGVGADAVSIADCEQSPGASMAFSAKSMAAKAFHGIGLGYVMCDVNFSEEKARCTYQPFIADKVDTRFMWHLKARGVSNEEIGSIFDGMNRTTVARRLELLPEPRKLPQDDDWIEAYANRLDLEPSQIDLMLEGKHE